MEEPEKIKITYERTAAILRKRDSSAQSTNELTIRVRYGCEDEIEGMGHKLVGSVLETTDRGDVIMRPAFLGLGGFGLCLARGYMKAFARKDIPVNGLLISLQARIDKRKAFAVAENVPAGYQSLRYRVEIDSGAGKDQLLEAMDEVESRSPWLYNFSRPIPVERDVSITRSAAAAAE